MPIMRLELQTSNRVEIIFLQIIFLKIFGEGRITPGTLLARLTELPELTGGLPVNISKHNL